MKFLNTHECRETPCVPDGTLLVATEDHRVLMVAPDGREFWEEICFTRNGAIRALQQRIRHRDAVEDVAAATRRRKAAYDNETSEEK